MIPPTVGELVEALRGVGTSLAIMARCATERDISVLAAINRDIVDALLERIDTPPPVDQPRDASKREHFQ